MNNSLSGNDLSDLFEKFEEDFAERRQSFFCSLTKDQQLLVFCEVVNKLVKAELDNRSSYRGVLYTEFGFETDAYVKAQVSGFLELHNSIESNPIDLNMFGSKLLSLYGIEQSKEEVKEKLEEAFKPVGKDSSSENNN